MDGPIDREGLNPMRELDLDTAVLDDPVGHSLGGAHAYLARRCGEAVRYDPEVASFSSVGARPGPGAWDDLVGLLGAGEFADLFSCPALPPAHWEPEFVLEGHQLVQVEQVRPALPGGLRAVELGAVDVPEMLDLVERTRPGPFRPRTRELGTYLGVRDRDGALLAMAGERLRPPGFTEVSAVCTAPRPAAGAWPPTWSANSPPGSPPAANAPSCTWPPPTPAHSPCTDGSASPAAPTWSSAASAPPDRTPDRTRRTAPAGPSPPDRPRPSAPVRTRPLRPAAPAPTGDLFRPRNRRVECGDLSCPRGAPPKRTSGDRMTVWTRPAAWWRSAIVLSAFLGIFLSNSSLVYFTIQSNVIVLGYFLAAVYWMARRDTADAPAPRLRGAAVLYITITGIVAHVLLNHGENPLPGLVSGPDRLQHWSSFFLHYTTPVLVLAEWLVFSPRNASRWRDLPLWLSYPLGYAVLTETRAVLFPDFPVRYPYFFLDPTEKGYAWVGLQMVQLVVEFAVLGALVIGLDRLGTRLRREPAPHPAPTPSEPARRRGQRVAPMRFETRAAVAATTGPSSRARAAVMREVRAEVEMAPMTVLLWSKTGAAMQRTSGSFSRSSTA